VTPDGRRVVSASEDQTLKVWDLESGRAVATLKGHADWVSACAVTPDGQRVVSASGDKTLKVWDLKSGRVLATMEGHADVVRTCAVTPDGLRVVSASEDKTLKVWGLESGHALATLDGHAGWVNACAVTPDGLRVISASNDKTLKVWDLATYACLFTHRGDAPYRAVAAGTAGVVAGDRTGGIWFLDWPPSHRRATQLGVGDRENRQPESRPAQETSSSRPTMKKHTILFLAANPTGTDPLALGEEARAIQIELERSGYRDCFELETRWAVQPLDLLRELRKLKPTVVHFSGHGGPSPAGTGATGLTPRRHVVATTGTYDHEPLRGLFFQGPDGRAQVVTAQALRETFGAAGSSVRLVVLSACYSDVQAEALRAHVDCVVGMSGAIIDHAARNFAIGFYGGLGERESIAAAFRQAARPSAWRGCATAIDRSSGSAMASMQITSSWPRNLHSLMPAPPLTRTRKQTMSLTINSELFAQAKGFGINVSQVAEDALAREVAARKAALLTSEIRQDRRSADQDQERRHLPVQQGVLSATIAPRSLRSTGDVQRIVCTDGRDDAHPFVTLLP
jgi:WD40 repeat protein/post-segregation antitoxin (ccd killing protein)